MHPDVYYFCWMHHLTSGHYKTEFLLCYCTKIIYVIVNDVKSAVNTHLQLIHVYY